jgi:glutathione S-transferase
MNPPVRASDWAMKLYYTPGACSLHPHIALREAGIAFDLVRVDLRAHKLQDGSDFYGINGKGYVPVLELDSGERLTEGAVIDQYIADQKPESKLVPAAGTIERYRVQSWLNFIASEVHKSFSPLFGPDETQKGPARKRVENRFDYLQKALADQPYLTGSTFTIADAYLFNMLQWAPHTGFDLDRWPALKAFHARVGDRPAVQAALAAEKGH